MSGSLVKLLQFHHHFRHHGLLGREGTSENVKGLSVTLAQQIEGIRVLLHSRTEGINLGEDCIMTS